MDAHAWNQVDRILEELLDRESEDRLAALDGLDIGDEVKREVRSLLEAGGHVPPFLSADAASFAAPAMEDDGISQQAVGRRQVGPYAILRELGHGGMGIVYLAERGDVGKRVALKLVRDRAADQKYLSRFLFEREVLARLEHPSIAQLVDAGVADDGTPWFAMEFVDGIPITQYCRDHRLSIDDRLSLFLSVCDAVHKAHTQLVVHRDLKPSNILVDTGGRIKLLDFGIAKFIDPDDDDPALTQTGFRLVTPAYGSPEQTTGKPITTATDIYSLGVLLYELLTDRRPYATEGLSQTELLRNICDVVPPSPSTTVRRLGDEALTSAGGDLKGLKRRLHGDLDDIVMTALKKEPGDRYGSVEAFADDVRRHFRNEPITAHPSTMAYRGRKFLVRNRVPVAAAVGLIALVVSFSVFYGVRITAERDRAELEAMRANEMSSFLVGLFESNDPGIAQGDALSVGEILDRGEERLAELNSEPELQARMFETIGSVRMALGQYAVAESLFATARRLFESVSGGSSGDVLRTTLLVGRSLYESGRYDDALSAHRSVAVALRDNPEMDDRLLIDAFLGMGLDYRRLSQLDSAEVYARKALDMARVSSNADSAKLCEALDNLGVVFGMQGKYEDADTIFQEGLATLLALHGETHPAVASALNNLATLKDRLGDFQGAEDLHRRVLTIRRLLFPDGHPDLAATLGDLGYNRARAGDLAGAIDLYQQALEIERRFFGNDHPEVALDLSNLAMAYYEMGDYERAELQAREALRIRLSVFGSENADVARSLDRIGQIRLARGHPDDAVNLISQSLAMRRRIFGETHRDIAEALDDLGLAYAAAGDTRKAEGLLMDGYNMRRGMYPSSHPLVLESVEHIETLLQEIGAEDRLTDFRRMREGDNPVE